MKLIDQILTSPYFTDKPPVLIDIGASIEINAKWRSIAKHSICLAFDADDRDFKIDVKSDAGYRKLYLFNRIVTADDRENADFYLTDSPYCSSLLEPDAGKLANWYFAPAFNVTEIRTVQSISIKEALQQAKINYIDWFKTDSQGTDLRLFQSLSSSLEKGVLIAEFEPGIMDAYKGEDKMYNVIKELAGKDFWLSTLNLKGIQRLNPRYKSQLHFSHNALIKESPGWTELTFLREPEDLDMRSTLLLIVFALLEEQYGFVLEIAFKASNRFEDKIFTEIHARMLNFLKNKKSTAVFVKIKRRIKSFLKM